MDSRSDCGLISACPTAAHPLAVHAIGKTAMSQVDVEGPKDRSEDAHEGPELMDTATNS